MDKNKIPYKIYLEEHEMPKQWYNVRADMKKKPAPILNPQTLEPITEMIRLGMSAEDIFFHITEGFDMIMENKAVEPKYECKCSKERMEKALIAIGKDELKALIDEQGEAELTCQFCDNRYTFDKGELEQLLAEAK